MLSYTQRRNLYGKFTKNTTTTNLTDGDLLMNEHEKKIVNTRAWDFTQRALTRTTIASQQFYNLHVNYRRIIGAPYVTVGTNRYTTQEVPTREEWDKLNSSSDTSDIPEYHFIFNKQIGFYPTPSSNGNTITIPIEIQAKDLSVADFTTGSIVTATNADETIVGTGTSWTAGMAGRYLKISEDNTADSGDNQWYEISSITDGTNLELVLPYQGTSISSATQGYTMGQLSILPDGYDLLPVYHAAVTYWTENPDPERRAQKYKESYNELLETLINDHTRKSSDPSFGNVDTSKNPNLYLSNLS